MDLGINITTSFPTDAEIDYFAAQGMTTLRLPITWETLQPQLNGPLDQSYLAQIEATVAYANSQGMNVILDMHNYGSYDGNLIGSDAVPTSSFANVWGQLASAFADNSNVMFGLMNEPQVASASDWLTDVNAAIASIRSSGATSQEILVSGIGWDGAATWTSNGNAAVLGAKGAIVDPSNNYAFEVHQYLDPGGAGQSAAVASASTGVDELQQITAWAQQNGVKLYLGEFGVANTPVAESALNNMLSYMNQNSDVWQGATYWAAGQFWGDYMYSVEPTLTLLDAPQMAVLDQYGDATKVTKTLANGDTEVDTTVAGSSTPSLVDILDSNGNLISRSLYDAQGELDRTLTENKDGTQTLAIYNGAATAGVVAVYNSADAILSETTYNSDGTKDIQLYNASGEPNVYQIYNTDGTLASETDNNYDGLVTMKQYNEGVITTSQTFDATTWSLLSQNTYDSQGRLVSKDTIDSSGDNTVSNYNSNGIITSTNVYNASWVLESQTAYDSSGNVTSIQTLMDNGGHQVETFTPGSSQASSIDQYNANWQLTTATTLNANGTYSQTDYAAAGSSTIASVAIFDTNWNLLTQTDYNSQGLVTQVQTNNSDGSHSIGRYDVAGSSEPTTLTHYDANWNTTEVDYYNASGAQTAIDHVAANGNNVLDNYTPGTNTVTSEEVYNSSWTLLSRTSYDANGDVSQVQTDNSDGTHSIARYNTPGSTSPSTITSYDSAWNTQEIQQFNASGALSSIDHFQANGDILVDFFSPGNAQQPTSEALYNSQWQQIGPVNNNPTAHA